MNFAKKTRDEQEERLKQILWKNKFVKEILQKAPRLELTNWYLGAGCIAQSVWNELSGFKITQNIKDYDLIYFDDSDLSYEAEDRWIKKIKQLFPRINMDIKNQARIHLWYHEHFGYKISAYTSLEHAISTWHATAAAVAVKFRAGNLAIHAPFGLDDLFSMTIRANKVQITRKIYQEKAIRWKQHWPKLTIIPW